MASTVGVFIVREEREKRGKRRAPWGPIIAVPPLALGWRWWALMPWLCRIRLPAARRATKPIGEARALVGEREEKGERARRGQARPRRCWAGSRRRKGGRRRRAGLLLWAERRKRERIKETIWKLMAGKLAWRL